MQKSQIIRRMRLVPLIFLFLGIGTSAFAIKPQPPLKLALWQATLPDGKIEVTFEALANVSVTSAELSFTLPESVSFLEGEEQWEGSLAVGEKKTLTILIQSVSTIPSKIVGKSTVHLSEGGSLVQQRTITLNQQALESPLPSDPPIKRKHGKETILEFKGK